MRVSFGTQEKAPVQSETRSLLALCGVVLFVICAALVLTYAPPFARSVFGNILVIAFSVVTITTVTVGVAITSVVPPLAKISDTSILGRRVVGFTKFLLAAAALLGTSYVAWLVNKSFDSATTGEQFSNAYNQLLQVVLVPVGFAGLVYWWWLSIDLLRLKRVGRRDAIDILMERAEQYLEPYGEGLAWWIRTLANACMGTWGWILITFYISPIVVMLLVTAPQLLAGR